MPGFLSILVGLCVTLGFILIFASRQYKRPRVWRGIGSFLLSIPAAALTYLMLGIHLARTHNLSRFYSWPFGGENIGNDGPLIASALFWIVVWFVVLFAASNLIPLDPDAQRRRTAQTKDHLKSA
jgi:hypothetical protein